MQRTPRSTLDQLRKFHAISSAREAALLALLSGDDQATKHEFFALLKTLQRDLLPLSDDEEKAAPRRRFDAGLATLLYRSRLDEQPSRIDASRAPPSKTPSPPSSSSSKLTSTTAVITSCTASSASNKRRSPSTPYDDSSPGSELEVSPGKRIRTLDQRTLPARSPSPTDKRGTAARLLASRGSFAARGRPQRTRAGEASTAARLDRAQDTLTGVTAKLSLRSDQSKAPATRVDPASHRPGPDSEICTPEPQRRPLPALAPVAATKMPALNKAGASAGPTSDPTCRMPAAVNDVVPALHRLKIMQRQSDGRSGVPWGTQFFLASLVSDGWITWDNINIVDGIGALRSESSLASMRQFYDRQVQAKLWDDAEQIWLPAWQTISQQEADTHAELDRENQALRRSPVAGVGASPDPRDDWFGGKVHFEAQVALAEGAQHKGWKPSAVTQDVKFEVRLLPPRLGASCRLTRRFGSERFIRLKVAPSLLKSLQRYDPSKEAERDFRDFLLRPFHILGRIFRPCLVKESAIWLLQVDEMYPSFYPLELRSVFSLYDHHGPWEENSGSTLGKYLQRMLLAISISTPAVLVDEIVYEDDVLGDVYEGRGSRRVMTDGAASASYSVFKAMADRLNYPTLPSAVQARVAGAKGVWFLVPNTDQRYDANAPRVIHVRSSQNKLKLPNFDDCDPCHKVIDLLTNAKTTLPSTLSQQILMVMSHGGVPNETFMALQRDHLSTIVELFANVDAGDGEVLINLAKEVDDCAGVAIGRVKRSMEMSAQRAHGLISRTDDDRNDARRSDGQDSFFSHDGYHLWSSRPLRRAECAYELLMAGFRPTENRYLADEIFSIADLEMTRVLRNFAIPLERSAEAMCMPDPTGVLEEGEMQFRFSIEGVVDPDTKLRIHHVPEGDVLVTRHPCLLPTDIQKVRAVVRPELAVFQDVVVFSTKGKRPLADLLSGGDYDGDLVRCFWDPRLVEPFRNAPEHFADLTPKLKARFVDNNVAVADFLDRHRDKPTGERDDELTQLLIKSLFARQLKGFYGNMHLVASYRYGCDSAEAVSLAHTFNQCMDSSKTGLELKEDVYRADSRRFNLQLPPWGVKDDGLEDLRKRNAFIYDGDRLPTVKRAARLPPCILDILHEQAQKHCIELKAQLRLRLNILEGARLDEDVALSRPWKEAMEKGRLEQHLVDAICRHVDFVLESVRLTNRQLASDYEREGKAAIAAGGRGGKADVRRKPKQRNARGAKSMQRTKSAPFPPSSQRDEIGASAEHRGGSGKLTRTRSDAGTLFDEALESSDDGWEALLRDPSALAKIEEVEHGAHARLSATAIAELEDDGDGDDEFVDARCYPPPSSSSTEAGDTPETSILFPSTSASTSVSTPSTAAVSSGSATGTLISSSVSSQLAPVPGLADGSSSSTEISFAFVPPMAPRAYDTIDELVQVFHAWPLELQGYLRGLDREEVERLQRLRASYAYSWCLSRYNWSPHKIRDLFELAWRDLLVLKAKETGRSVTVRKEAWLHCRLKKPPGR
ncbi:uncharacterized protein PFL1_06710 [Pseudozyma flocculosa PF-1]|uniref:RDRP core domain-containing protein n=2 Tax=Pseudozyma flocculosa TaxID=84751 RepID=A0A5C3F650_9BASI|nr:uncharacterized protein PFL1_06710 [Pseudozyma flocculosa PF-1]EPQ25716.1 hypothetical protein PFL1_06710 [Pseudozyma flocculosa PF-1]SPO38909.1 uncharacterized protein PSFLO_04388 [Pseudozyma flocculosa]